MELNLEIGTPEETLDLGYGFAWSLEWAAKVAGPGAVILLVLLVLRFVRRAGRDIGSKTPQTP